jgi:protocatechuate 3,4-dioxygenase beta subunit
MAQVTALSLDADRPLRTTAFTDDAGRATIADAVGLPLRLVVEAPGFARWTKQLDKAPAKVTAELSSGVLVEGHITSVRGRRDVAGATVEVVSEGQRRKATTDSDGRYRFADVTPGPAHVIVSHPDFALAERDIVIESTGRSDRPFDVDAIDLPEPGTIEGRVLDANGQPVSGARVRAATAGTIASIPANAPGTALTDSDGAFRLERVASGKIDVRALSTRAGRGHTTVDVEAGRTTSDVTIRMVASGAEEAPSANGGVAVTLDGATAGVLIVEVSPGSEAERGGLVVGDRVERVDGTHPASVDDAKRLLAGPEGTDVVIEVARRSEQVVLRVRRDAVRR